LSLRGKKVPVRRTGAYRHKKALDNYNSLIRSEWLIQWGILFHSETLVE